VARSVLRRPSPSTDVAIRQLGADLERIGVEAGLAAVGIGEAGLHAGMQFTYRNPDRSTDPSRILDGARSLVVGAWGYRRAEPETAGSPGPPAGTVARYARRDHYASLRVGLGLMAARLVEDGWRTAVVVDDNALVDRAAAHRAGLGWFGRNTMLLLPGLGSWFVLGTVVTDAPLVPIPTTGPSGPAEGCGSCQRCRTACPTGALVADGVLDAGRCLAWLVQAPGTFPPEFRQALGGRIYGCDECQQVCPINRVADRRRAPAPPEPDTVSTVDLLALLAATDAELLAAHGRWYIAGRDPRYLRRNALVALGNIGDAGDPATVATIDTWVRSDDGLLAEHARWAADRLGLSDRVGPPTGSHR
jgi:epoxyqueuosine reductase